MHSKPLENKIVQELYIRIPEYHEYVVNNIDNGFIENNYLIFGPFGSLLKGWIMNNSSAELIDRSFAYINQLCEKDDKSIEQMLKVTFFESLIDGGKAISKSRNKLKGEALAYFNDVLNGPIFQGRYQ